MIFGKLKNPYNYNIEIILSFISPCVYQINNIDKLHYDVITVNYNTYYNGNISLQNKFITLTDYNNKLRKWKIKIIMI